MESERHSQARKHGSAGRSKKVSKWNNLRGKTYTGWGRGKGEKTPFTESEYKNSFLSKPRYWGEKGKTKMSYKEYRMRHKYITDCKKFPSYRSVLMRKPNKKKIACA